jgi:hypothetical protein
MSAEIKQEIALEIAHVFFIDIVAYSKMAMDDQRAIRAFKNWPLRPRRNKFVEAAVSAAF